MPVETGSHYALVVIGFGPASIALMAAIDDGIEKGRLPGSLRSRVLCLEQTASTVWQGGLLLPGTNINHSPLRDLATPRDPASRFTFAQYLKDRGRLYQHGAWTGAVSRIEWSDYVGWTAKRLSEYVAYGQRVESVSALAPDSLEIRTGTGTFLARGVVIACGYEAYTPECLASLGSERVRHAANYLFYRSEIDALVSSRRATPLRIAVIGSGLSAAEVIQDMLQRYEPSAIRLTSVHRGLPFRHYDMSQFSNRIYMPGEEGRLGIATPERRRAEFRRTWATNFSGVDAECSAQLWNFIYEREVMGINNFEIVQRHLLEGASLSGGRVKLALRDELTDRESDPPGFDFVISATGYLDTAPERLLANLGMPLRREFDGLLSVGTEYRVETTDSADPAIWLNGHSERTHGIAHAQSFSLLAYRAERLLADVERRLAEDFGQDQPEPQRYAAPRQLDCAPSAA